MESTRSAETEVVSRTERFEKAKKSKRRNQKDKGKPKHKQKIKETN